MPDRFGADERRRIVRDLRADIDSGDRFQLFGSVAYGEITATAAQRAGYPSTLLSVEERAIIPPQEDKTHRMKKRQRLTGMTTGLSLQCLLSLMHTEAK